MNSQKEAERKEQNEKVVDGLAIVSILKLRLTTNHSRNNGNLDLMHETHENLAREIISLNFKEKCIEFP
jgi:hypothetical protein